MINLELSPGHENIQGMIRQMANSMIRPINRGKTINIWHADYPNMPIIELRPY